MRRSHGRLGTEVTYPKGTVDLMAAWAQLPKSNRGWIKAALILFGSGYEVPPETFRKARRAWQNSLEGQAASGLLATGSAMGAAVLPGALGRLMRQNLRRWLEAHPDEVTGEPECVGPVLESVARVSIGVVNMASTRAASLQTERAAESKPDAAARTVPLERGLEHYDLEEWTGAIGLDMIDGALRILEKREAGNDNEDHDPSPRAAQHAADFLKLFQPELLDKVVDSVSDEELQTARDDARILFRAVSDLAELVSFRISEEGIDPTIRTMLASGFGVLRHTREVIGGEITDDPSFYALLLPFYILAARQYPENATLLRDLCVAKGAPLHAFAEFVRGLPGALRRRLRVARPISKGRDPSLTEALQREFQQWSLAHPALAQPLLDVTEQGDETGTPTLTRLPGSGSHSDG
jgi:hypothetical protein